MFEERKTLYFSTRTMKYGGGSNMVWDCFAAFDYDSLPAQMER